MEINPQLITEIMNLPPEWLITNVQVDHSNEAVHIYIEQEEGYMYKCPQCSFITEDVMKRHENIWRHFSVLGYQSFIKAHSVFVFCPKHKEQQIRYPWEDAVKKRL